jgi:hypothetical protein
MTKRPVTAWRLGDWPEASAEISRHVSRGDAKRETRMWLKSGARWAESGIMASAISDINDS